MINPMECINSVRSIPPEIDPLQLEKDLDHLRQQAIQAGAADAIIIDEKDVIFNQDILLQVAADASYPSIHWPLNYPLDDVEEAIRAYQKGLFFSVKANFDVKYGGGANSIAYSLTKHALEFFPSDYKNWACKNVFLNTVRVGLTNTKIHKNDLSKNLQKRISQVPLKRMASPAEIAQMIYFLGSNNNTFITGEIVSVTGGE